jgi:hypothetical protein
MAEPSIKDLAYRTAAGVFGGPVDLATMVMRPFGYKTPDEQVFGSSEYIGKKLEDVGLVSSARAPITEFLTSMAVPTPGGIAKGAALAAPMIGGMFVGKGAKTWDALAATKAKMLADMGTDARTIWKETGTWKGPDGKWRQEIDDSFSYIKGQEGTVLGALKYGNKPENIMSHPRLEKSYAMDDVRIGSPEIMTSYGSRSTVKVNPSIDDLLNADDLLAVQPKQISEINVSRTSPDQRSTLLHEIQHDIQQREGFATGGSPSQMVTTLEDIAGEKRKKAQEMFRLSSANDPLDPLRLVKPGARKKGLALEKEARAIEQKALNAYRSEQTKFDLYQRLAGEAEARATQARMNMTPAQRQAMFPEESYDVPINELIIRGVSD